MISKLLTQPLVLLANWPPRPELKITPSQIHMLPEYVLPVLVTPPQSLLVGV